MFARTTPLTVWRSASRSRQWCTPALAFSGGAFNPAVGIGPQIMEAISGGGFDASTLALYGVGPLVGGGLAAVVYKFLNAD